MALELVAALVCAMGMAGIAIMLVKLSRGRLPKWLVPVFAAIGLIGVTILLEYGWASRVQGDLPEGVVVVTEESFGAPLRPWTYAVPMVSRFVALDTRAAAAHPEVPGLRMLPAYLFARWRNPEQLVMVFDCDGNRSVVLTEGARITDEGQLEGGDWVVEPQGSKMHSVACKG